MITHLVIYSIIFYFKEIYRMIAIYLGKQQALDADPRAIQDVDFTKSLAGDESTRMFFILEEPKETVLDFSQGTVAVL